MSTILIKNIVEKEFGLDITKRTRRREYVEARAIYYGLLRDYTTLGLANIGRSIKKNHATVLHGQRNLKDWLVVDKRIMEIYSKLEGKLKRIVAENPKAFSEIRDTEDYYEAKYFQLKRKYEKLKEKLNN